MERWIGKVAVVTGASSGIGAAIAKDLTNAGLIVIGLARRVDRMQEMRKSLSAANGEFHPYSCDTGCLESIKDAFNLIRDKFGKIQILINNAGIGRNTSILTEDNEETLRRVVEVNLLGYIYCTKEAYKIMKASDDEVHIFNVSSILGQSVPFCLISPFYNLYPSTKFGVNAAAEVLRQELLKDKRFRITTINPGLVKTEITVAGDIENSGEILNVPNILCPENVSAVVLFALSMPKNAVISHVTIKPQGEEF